MSLDLDKLSALFELLAEKDIAEFEHEEGGVRVRVTRQTAALIAAAGHPSPFHRSFLTRLRAAPRRHPGRSHRGRRGRLARRYEARSSEASSDLRRPTRPHSST